jgi:hypothetical protein
MNLSDSRHIETKKSKRKRRLRIFLVIIVIFTLALFVEELDFYFRNPSVQSSAHNAIWLRHSWIDNKHTDAEYRELVDRFHRMQIVDVYFHAGPLDGNGSVSKAKLDGSARLIRIIKKLDPGIRMQPWLGQVAEFGGGGPLDLRSPEVRAEIVRTAEKYLNVGAAGFHLDLEPIYSGDLDYLQLLRELHKVTQTHKAILSVAAYKPEEFPGLERIAALIAKCPGYWSKEYFLLVSKEVDQVAVMTYDSAIWLPGVYGRSIQWTTQWAVENGVKDLYIGIPTYEEGGPAHFAWAENINSSIKGLKLGVSGLSRNDRSKVGAAIFAEWTTSKEEEESFITKYLTK